MKTTLNETGFVQLAGLNPRDRRKKNAILSRKTRQIRLGRGLTVVDLIAQYADAGIQARNIGLVAQVAERMCKDAKRPTIYFGMAGPLIAAGLRKVIRDMVEVGIIDVLVSTGAILYQDIYQAKGGRHYIGTPDADDALLHDLRIDRIYDTYVDEEKFWECDAWCGRVADHLREGNWSSRAYLDEIGSRLSDPESIVRTCHLRGVPIFCPAINDSSIGIGLTDHRIRMRKKGRFGISIDSIRDNHEITQTIVKSPATSAIYIAGGVPKNYVNDAVVMSYLYGMERGHDYAVQLTADNPHWGGLSGSTLSEAKSWGKVDEKASTAMALSEPSVSLPLVAGYLLGKGIGPKRGRIAWTWQGENLLSRKVKKK